MKCFGAVLTRWRVQGDGITTMLDSEEETGTGMVKAVLKVFIPDECTGQSVSVSNFVAPSLSAACPSQPNLIAKIIAISTVPQLIKVCAIAGRPAQRHKQGQATRTKWSDDPSAAAGEPL